jgi:hypothetical protein
MVELASLPHIIMTSDVEWDPSTYDKELDDLAMFYEASDKDHEERHFDQYGDYRLRTVATHHTCGEKEFYDACEFFDFDNQVDDLLDTIYPDIVSDIYDVHSSELSKVTPNFDLL